MWRTRRLPVAYVVLSALAASACSSSNSGGYVPTEDGYFLPDSVLDAADVAASDTVGGADSGTDQDALADAISSEPDTAVQADAGPDIDFDLLDPEDDATTGSDAVANPDLTTVFAHTSSTLYRMDSGGFTKIGSFSFNKNSGSVTDIAIDDNGLLFAITFDDLFQCQTKTAKCTGLASLPQSFNGLTFVPKGTASLAKAALIGISNSGDWNLIEVVGTTATVQKIGSYGSLSSSGDAFSLEGQGTYATAKQFGASSDILIQIDPANGSVIKQIGPTGVSDLWGVAWSQGTMYGFSDGGGVYSIDLSTGKASSVPGLSVPSGLSWWGAGVSTRAAIQ